MQGSKTLQKKLEQNNQKAKKALDDAKKKSTAEIQKVGSSDSNSSSRELQLPLCKIDDLYNCWLSSGCIWCLTFSPASLDSQSHMPIQSNSSFGKSLFLDAGRWITSNISPLERAQVRKLYCTPVSVLYPLHINEVILLLHWPRRWHTQACKCVCVRVNHQSMITGPRWGEAGARGGGRRTAEGCRGTHIACGLV